MTHKLYYVGLRWGGEPPQIGPLEKAFDPLGDWIRFNSFTWFLSTDRSSVELYQALEPTLRGDDLLLVIAVDPTDRFGLAPRWIWDWIDGQLQERPESAASILARGSSRGGIGGDNRSRVGADPTRDISGRGGIGGGGGAGIGGSRTGIQQSRR